MQRRQACIVTALNARVKQLFALSSCSEDSLEEGGGGGGGGDRALQRRVLNSAFSRYSEQQTWSAAT